MSHSALWELYPKTTKPPKQVFEMRNSWGTAPYVWDLVALKYLGRKFFIYPHNEQSDCEVWKLVERVDVPVSTKATMLFTYDRAYVLRKNFHKLAGHLLQFCLDFPHVKDYVNHLPSIVKFLISSECEALGLECTSVSGHTFHGKYNEEIEDYDPLDWDTAFEIYEEIEVITAAMPAVAQK